MSSRDDNMDQLEFSEEDSQTKDAPEVPEDLSMGSKEENHPQRNSIEK